MIDNIDTAKALELIEAIEVHRDQERSLYWSQIDPELHSMFDEILDLRSVARNAQEEAESAIASFDAEDIEV